MAVESPRIPSSEEVCQLAAAIARDSDHARALELAKTVTAYHSKDVRALCDVGAMLFALGKRGEAQALYITASRVDPRAALPFSRLGEVLFDRGDLGRAEKAIARAVELGDLSAPTRQMAEKIRAAMSQRSQPATSPAVSAMPEPKPEPPASLKETSGPAGTRDSRSDTLESTATTVVSRGPPNASPRKPPPLRRVPAASPPQVVVAEKSSSSPEARSVESAREAAQPASREGQLAATLVATEAPLRPAVPEAANSSLAGSRLAVPPPREHGDAPLSGTLATARAVGLYAPPSEGESWAQPPVGETRSIRALLFCCAVVVIFGSLTYLYGSRVRERRAALAGEMAGQALESIQKGDFRRLPHLEADIQRAVSFGGLSAKAAEIRIQGLVARSLLGAPASTLYSALAAGEEAGAARTVLAYGRAAALLEDDDVVGAVETVLRDDALAGRDPWFQLVAAHAFERAGLEQAVLRYEAVQRLAPNMVLGHVLAARYGVLEKRAALTRKSLGALEKLAPNLPVVALLARAGASQEGEAALRERRRVIDTGDGLPPIFMPVLFLERARESFHEGNRPGMRVSLQQGIAVSKSPAALTALGQLALDLRDQELVRAVLTKLTPFAPIHGPARALSVRVALGSGELEKARALIEASPKAEVERRWLGAIDAYEDLDAQLLGEQLSNRREARASSDFAALATGAQIMVGSGALTREQLESLERSSLPWARLVAVDAALDNDHLDLAQKWLEGLGPRPAPVFALRRAELARYQAEPEEALGFVEQAAELRGRRRYTLGAVRALVHQGRLEQARSLVLDYSAAKESSEKATSTRMSDKNLAPWLEAYIDVHDRYRARARQKVLRMMPFGEGSPLAWQVLAVETMMLVSDPRGAATLKDLGARAPRHPDVINLLSKR